MNTYDELSNKELNGALEAVRLGFIGGAAGGLAEIAWVTLYAVATGANPAMLARGVTTAVGANALFPTAPVALGLAVHMTIAVAIGIALAVVWRMLSSYRSVTINLFSFMVSALVGIWALNFFFVLPIISPAFIHLVPYSVSLISKIVFGLAAATAFSCLATPELNIRRARIARGLL